MRRSRKALLAVSTEFLDILHRAPRLTPNRSRHYKQSSCSFGYAKHASTGRDMIVSMSPKGDARHSFMADQTPIIPVSPLVYGWINL